jgi:pyruvate ferredoxin oxidoreductase beta subunit
VVDGTWNLTVKVSNKKPVEEYLKIQGRFAHLFSEEKNKEVRRLIQENTDREWQKLLKMCGEE